MIVRSPCRRGLLVPALSPTVALLLATPAGAQDRMVGAWELNRFGPGMCALTTPASGGAAIVGLVEYRGTPFSFQLSFRADAAKLKTGSYGLSLDGGAPVAAAKLTPPGFGSAFKPPLPEGKEMKAWVEVPKAQMAALRAAKTIAIVRTDAKAAPVVSIAAPAIGQGLDALTDCLGVVDAPRPAPPPPPPEPKAPTAPFSNALSIGVWRIDPAKNCEIGARIKGYPHDRSAQVLGSLGFPDLIVEIRKFGPTRYQFSIINMPQPKRVTATDWNFRLGGVQVKAPLVPVAYPQVGPVGTFDNLPPLLGGKRDLVIRYRAGGKDVDHISVDLNHLDIALKAQAMCRAR